jgi:hypothetical protein
MLITNFIHILIRDSSSGQDTSIELGNFITFYKRPVYFKSSIIIL